MLTFDDLVRAFHQCSINCPTIAPGRIPPMRSKMRLWVRLPFSFVSNGSTAFLTHPPTATDLAPHYPPSKTVPPQANNTLPVGTPTRSGWSAHRYSQKHFAPCQFAPDDCQTDRSFCRIGGKAAQPDGVGAGHGEVDEIRYRRAAGNGARLVKNIHIRQGVQVSGTGVAALRSGGQPLVGKALAF